MSTSRNARKHAPEPLRLECLEERCVLSAFGLDFSAPGLLSSLASVGAGLSSAELQADGKITPAWVVGESDETLANASASSLGAGDELSFLGYIGNSLVLNDDAQANDVDVIGLELTGSEDLVVYFDLLARCYGSDLDPTLTVIDASGQIVARWTSTPALFGAVGFGQHDWEDVRRSILLSPGQYFLLVAAEGAGPTTGTVSLATPVSSAEGHAVTTGGYALFVRAEPYMGPVTIESLAVSNESNPHLPITVEVRFSGEIDPNTLGDSVGLVDSAGTAHRLIWTGYDSTSRTATYILGDRLPSGEYTLAISASKLRDAGGLPVLTAAPLSFTLESPAVVWGEGASDASGVVKLPYTYPLEVAEGVTVAGRGDGEGDVDEFQFTVPGSGTYVFEIAGPSTSVLAIVDQNGNAVATLQPGTNVRVPLSAGVVFLRVSSTGGASYAITVTMNGKIPGVPVEVDLPLPDMSVRIVGPGAVLPDLPTIGPDPALAKVVTSPFDRVVLDYLSYTTEDAPSEGPGTNRVVRSASEVQQFAEVSPNADLLPPLVTSGFSSNESARVATEVLTKDSLALYARSTAEPQGARVSTLEAIGYALRTLWTPAPTLEPAEFDVDWNRLVQALQADGTPAVATDGPKQDMPSSVTERSSAPSVETLATELETDRISETAGATAAVLGTGVATTGPVRRALASLLRKLANWLSA